MRLIKKPSVRFLLSQNDKVDHDFFSSFFIKLIIIFVAGIFLRGAEKTGRSHFVHTGRSILGEQKRKFFKIENF
jgi:hypothetical protein